MATVCGFVERIKYRNEDNGYTVLSLVNEGEEYTLVGNFHYISEGEMVEAVGAMTEHPVYGEQMTVETYEIKTPEDTAAMERYLGSGAIKGVGAALAARIVKRFKADTFRIMEEEPERLSEVKGVSEKMAMAISQQVEQKKEMRQAMMFLQEYGISMNLAAKIYQEYGPRLYGIIKENPYQMADDIPGRWAFSRIPISGSSAECSTVFYRLRQMVTPIFRKRSFSARLQNFLRWIVS